MSAVSAEDLARRSMMMDNNDDDTASSDGSFKPPLLSDYANKLFVERASPKTAISPVTSRLRPMSLDASSPQRLLQYQAAHKNLYGSSLTPWKSNSPVNGTDSHVKPAMTTNTAMSSTDSCRASQSPKASSNPSTGYLTPGLKPSKTQSFTRSAAPDLTGHKGSSIRARRLGRVASASQRVLKLRSEEPREAPFSEPKEPESSTLRDFNQTRAQSPLPAAEKPLRSNRIRFAAENEEIPSSHYSPPTDSQNASSSLLNSSSSSSSLSFSSSDRQAERQTSFSKTDYDEKTPSRLIDAAPSYLKYASSRFNDSGKLLQQSRTPLQAISPNVVPSDRVEGPKHPPPKMSILHGQINQSNPSGRVDTVKPNQPSQHSIPSQPLPSVQPCQPTFFPLQPQPQSQSHSQPQSKTQPERPHKQKNTMAINGRLYQRLELIGRGGSSKVYKAQSNNGKVFAVKKVTFDDVDTSVIEGFKGEIDLLQRLRNEERVVKLIDFEMHETLVYVVMECGEIDLAHVLAARLSLPLDVPFVRYYSLEMLKCVQAVHKHGIVHSDLKPANFLLVKGMLKIIDFGIANVVPDYTSNIHRDTQIGTPNYMAPEALLDANQSAVVGGGFASSAAAKFKVGKPSDVWSCGCILYQMIYGKPPYASYQGPQRMLAIMNPKVQIQYPSVGLGQVKVSWDIIETIKGCLERDPASRWTVDKVVNGSFLNPQAVDRHFIKELLEHAVQYGVSRDTMISAGELNILSDDIWKQIERRNARR